jgi:hypothetical protein
MTVPLLFIAAMPQIQRAPVTALAPASGITISTTRPRVDVPTAFKLSGAAASATWDFGDGSAPQAGGASISHTYHATGTFTVKATAGRSAYQQSITIAEPRRIVATPTSPAPGKAAVFSLEEPLGSSLVWNFGDGGRPLPGGASMSHAFAKEGSYTVTVKDGAETTAREFQVAISVGTQNSSAAFSISYLALRWEDGSTERSVRQGDTGLMAFADVKFDGAGQLQAEWLVDGQSLRTVNLPLGAIKLATMPAGRVTAVAIPARAATVPPTGTPAITAAAPSGLQIELPTNVAGEHRVTLKVLQPKLAFPVPVLRYDVKGAGEAQGPVIQSISPAQANPGQEVELTLTGSGFTEGMAVNLGKDVAALGKPQILSPNKAVVKVFVAPSAQTGSRTLQARGRGGVSPAAKLEIVPQGKLAAARTESLKVATTAKPGLHTVPASFRSPSVDLSKVAKVSLASSKLVTVRGGKSPGAVLDPGAAKRNEKVLTCGEGQRLDLTKVTLTAPSFSLIGYNSGGEFPQDSLPVLRDTTQFTWQEKSTGTSEYFELQFYTAKGGTLLKTVKVPGNRHSYDVTPAFVQELSRLYASAAPAPSVSAALTAPRTPSQANKTAVGSGTSSGSSTPKAPAPTPAKAGTSPRAQTVALAGGTPKTGSGSALNPALTGTRGPALAKAPEPDLVIPTPMQQKAQVVWRVIGFRSYPCLAEGTPNPGTSAAPAGTVPPASSVTLDRKAPTPNPIGRPVPTPPADPRHMNASPLKPLAPSARATQPQGLNPAPIQASQALAQAPVAPQVYQTVAAEVSRSSVWPLRMPITPQGVNPNACTVSMNDPKVVLEANKSGQNGSSSVVRASSKPKNTLDENTYTYDEVWLHGTFDLSAQKVPYRLIPSSVLAKGANPPASKGAIAAAHAAGPFASHASTSGSQSQQIATQAGLITFKNVFVDWGDGTIEPFRGRPVDAIYTSANGNNAGLDFYSTYQVDGGMFKHTYTRSAIDPPYRVKVFVLSEEDMGRGDMVGQVAQALTPTQSTKGVFTRLSSLAPATSIQPISRSVASSASARLATQPASGPAKPPVLSSGALLNAAPSASQALGRAYVIYCHDFRVVEREDPCANGPLNLVEIGLEFPKNDGTSTKLLAPPATASRSLAPPDLKTRQTPAATSASALHTSAATSTASKTVAGETARINPSAVASVAPRPQTGPNPPSTTPCNLFYSATTHLKFYGQGTVRVVWKVDGQQVGSREVPVKSPKRVGLKQSECLSCQNPLLGDLSLNSPALPVDSLGRHIATVEAEVLPDKSGDLDLSGLTLHLASNFAPAANGRTAEPALSPRTAHAISAVLGKTTTTKTPVRLGLLNPSQTPGQPAFIPLNQVAGLAGLQKTLATLTGPPYHVSTEGVYEVKASQPGLICNLFFPTKGGKFPITNLGSTLKLTPEGALSKASGKGLLVLGVKAGTAPDAVAPFPLDISFSDWKVEDITVAQGQIDLSPNQPYSGPGVNGTLLKVHGAIADKNAPQDMLARLKLSPIDTSIVTGDGTQRPEWTAEAPISVHGDWIASKGVDGQALKLGTTKLGPTPWFFSAEGVVIDLSGTEGSDPNGGSTPDWVGVKLGTVTVIPATLGIQGGQWSASLPKPANWTIEGLGVKGKLDTGPWGTDYRSGHLAIANIHFEGTKEGHYAAFYKGVEIRSPWFKDPIKGDATWFKQEGAGNYVLNLDKIHTDKRPTLAGGALSLDPLDLQFVQIKEGGLLLQGRAHIALKAEGKALTNFNADRVGFGLDGLLYFGDDGQRSTTVTLNTPSALGPTPADLQTAVLVGGNAKESPLDLQVNAKLRLSDNPVIPGTPATMHYALKAGGTPGSFTAPDVKVDPFNTDISFPLGSPSMKAKVNTNYKPGAAASGMTRPSAIHLVPAKSALAAEDSSASFSSLSTNRFAGEVDLAMFGGDPVKAQFILGYDKGKDYFATRVDIPLSKNGVVIIPEAMSLYKLSGGFAYNFGKEIFKPGNSFQNTQPDFNGVTQFMAGARLGSADKFAYTVDGQLVIASTGSARMDLDAWLLTSETSGTAPLHGCLEYANGNFDGRFWGGFKFMNGAANINLGATEQTASCTLHFGGGKWHINAGDRDGYRITGNLLGATADAYLMVGNEVGFAVGGRANYNFGAGVGGVNAYARAWLDMGLQITPQPHMIGDFAAGMEAGICLSHVGCISAGVNAHIHAEAMPISITADCCIDLPWPLGDACFTVKM